MPSSEAKKAAPRSNSEDSSQANSPKVAPGFEMHLQLQQPSKYHKKRKREISNNLDLSSSSSSSSDEDDDTRRVPAHKSRLGDGTEASTIEQKIHPRKVDDSAFATSSQDNVKVSIKGSFHFQSQQQPEGWRVKLYRLNADGSWDDCGTGRILCLYKQVAKDNSNGTSAGDAWIYQELGEPTLCMHSEVSTTVGVSDPRILLRTRILLRDAYQRQGDNIITWCEPFLDDRNATPGVDLALSFQDNSGCLDIWRQITQVQSKAADLFRRAGGDRANSLSLDTNSSETSDNMDNATASSPLGSTATGDAHVIASHHHPTLQRPEQPEMWANAEAENLENQMSMDKRNQQCHQFDDGYNDNDSSAQSAMNSQSLQLPNPPTVGSLEEIADTIASVQHIQQRESLALHISQNDCSYLKSLLSLFPSAESRGDYSSLATLAACVKTILLLNDPSIIELIVSDEHIFEDVCATLEYDPDLRDKANHRWFLRERAKFRTVVWMEDEELVAAIHRSFRVNYLRDTLLRPTMDESSLSTLSSLQTFTHADVVKGVTTSPVGSEDKGELLKDSYLAKVIRVLGRELQSTCTMEWEEIENLPSGSDIRTFVAQRKEESPAVPSTETSAGKFLQSQKPSTIWKQHLAPQDDSLASRRARRRGSLSFLRELFNMVRISLQQSDKDDFFAVLVSMEVDLSYTKDQKARAAKEGGNGTVNERGGESRFSQSLQPVNLLSLLGTMLSDPNTDATEKGSVLEIISGIAMHDPNLIRLRCLDYYSVWNKDRSDNNRPKPNGKRQIIFHCPPDDLMTSLLFLLAVETDAGVLLQVSEIMRIILDTDMMGDHGPMGASFADEAEGLPPGGHIAPHDLQNHHSGSTTDQNQFLSMFYDHYIQWLAAPFQYAILYPVRRVPNYVLSAPSESQLMQATLKRFEKGDCEDDPMLCIASLCALRSSFAVELLSFCVRAHLYRMKCYLLRSGVLGSVLKLLKPSTSARVSSGDRCLKLAALRFLRAILSVNDEFYHRHIIQHNLFGPVFEAFRANPVGDNLVSSATVEMCDFIHTENIYSLIEHIVTKHLSGEESKNPSLEDLSSTYVNTLTVLRKAYEKTSKELNMNQNNDSKEETIVEGGEGSRYFNGGSLGRRVAMSEKALEDQVSPVLSLFLVLLTRYSNQSSIPKRKFREIDQEESYFDGDDEDEEPPSHSFTPPAAQEGEGELHRTPRMFSLSQAPLLSSGIMHGSFTEQKDIKKATKQPLS
eukprot:scaffold1697_cov120-Cylindrotheca_fusiformis.AAC.40